MKDHLVSNDDKKAVRAGGKGGGRGEVRAGSGGMRWHGIEEATRERACARARVSAADKVPGSCTEWSTSTTKWLQCQGKPRRIEVIPDVWRKF